MVEYDRYQAVGTVDYKLRRGLDWADGDRYVTPTAQVMSSLYRSNGMQLPHFVVAYDRDPWRFRVVGGNPSADSRLARTFGSTDVTMSEVGYVDWLYHIRGRDLPAELAAILDGAL